MLRAGRLGLAKGVLAQLAHEAYRRRDRVALVHFGGHGAHVLLPPQRAGALPDAWILPLGGGGGTPLADALATADALLRRQAQGPRVLWLLTDARSRENPPRPRHAEHLCLIDFDDARVPLGRAAELAARWGAELRPAHAFWAPAA